MKPDAFVRMGPCAARLSFIINMLIGIAGVYQLSNDALWVKVFVAVLALVNLGFVICQCRHMDFTLNELRVQNDLALTNMSKIVYKGLVQELRIRVAQSAHGNYLTNREALDELDTVSNPDTVIAGFEFYGKLYKNKRALDLVHELRSIDFGPEGNYI
jgi:hypothetical protein